MTEPSVPPELAEKEVARTINALLAARHMPTERILWSALVEQGARYRGLLGLRLASLLNMSECRDVALDILDSESPGSPGGLRWEANLLGLERAGSGADLLALVEDRLDLEDWNGLWELPTMTSVSEVAKNELRFWLGITIASAVETMMRAEVVRGFSDYNWHRPHVALRNGWTVSREVGKLWNPGELEAVSFFIAAFCPISPHGFYALVANKHVSLVKDVAALIVDEVEDCSRCGTRCHHYSLSEVEGESGSWCENCISDYSFCCTSCERTFPDTQWNESPGGDGICNECRENHVVECWNCGSDRWTDEDCERCDAASHGSGGEYGPLGVQYYSYKPEAKFHFRDGSVIACEWWPAESGRTTDDGIFFGVELETNVRGNSQQRQEGGRILFESSLFSGLGFLYAKSDCSVSGPELVSHPATLSAHRKLWEEFPFRELVAQNWSGWAGANAGIHVHVDRRAFRDKAHLARFQIYFGEWRNELTSFAGRNCGSYGYHGDYMRGATRAVRYARNQSVPPRGSAINYENSGTIEVRMFRSSLRYTTVMAYLEFLHGLIHYSWEKRSNHILSERGLLFSTFADWMSDTNGNIYDNALTRITERVTL